MANTKSKVSKNTSETTKFTEVNTEAKEKQITSNTVSGERKKYRIKNELDPNMIVTVKNGTQGVLIYKSKRTGERFEWSDFGDEQDMELQELKNAKNSSKAFFANNWFLIDDPEVLDYLGVSQYYKYALNFAEFDELFESDIKKIKETVSQLSVGQKKSVAYRAKQLIADGVIDSIKVISALEESLLIELIDRNK